jgi:hypothetical protein
VTDAVKDVARSPYIGLKIQSVQLKINPLIATSTNDPEQVSQVPITAEKFALGLGLKQWEPTTMYGICGGRQFAMYSRSGTGISSDPCHICTGGYVVQKFPRSCTRPLSRSLHLELALPDFLTESFTCSFSLR